MKWIKERPKESGRYFRTNSGRQIVIPVRVYDFSEFTPTRGLEMISTDDSFKNWPIHETPTTWYWFGPIPDPPKDADWVSKERKDK